MPPSILGEELNVSVVANESVTLECQSQAVPLPVLSWRKDGHPLELRPGIHLSADKALLEVCGLLGGWWGAHSAELAPGRAGPVGALPRLVQLSATQCPGHPTPTPTGSEAAAGPPLVPAKLSLSLPTYFPLLVQKPPGLWALEPFIGLLAQQGKGGLGSGTLGSAWI